jgi:hypothetical protein
VRILTGLLRLIWKPFEVVIGLVFATFVFVAIGLYWLFGTRIKITKGDETLGYVKWFRYTPINK